MGARTLCLACFPYSPDLTLDHPRGIDRYAQELVVGLRDRSGQVAVIGAVGPHRSWTELVWASVRYLLEAAPTRAEVYHAIDPLGAVPLILLGKRPLVVTVHDSLWFAHPEILKPAPRPLRFLLMRAIVWAALRWSDRLVVPFSSTQRDLVSILPSCGERVRLVPYGFGPPSTNPRVDGDASSTSTPTASSTRQATNHRVVFMGGTQPVVRGGLACLAILARLKEDGVSVTLDFVGAGPEMALARKECSRLKIEDRVAFQPLVPEGEMPRFLSGFEALLYPSPLGFSYLLLQSMSVGTPVVSTAVRDLVDFVGTDGVLCTEGDIEGLTNEIRRLVEDSDYKREMSLRARRRASLYGIERFVQGVSQVYRECGAASV